MATASRTSDGDRLLGGLLPVRVLGAGPPLVVLGGLSPERTRPALLAARRELQPWAARPGSGPQLKEAAHRRGGTVNDAVLSAVTGSLHTLLRRHDESADPLMVAARRTATVQELGNAVTPLVVAVPAEPDPATRLAGIAGSVRAQRPTAIGPSLATPLGPVFRAVAARGVPQVPAAPAPSARTAEQSALTARRRLPGRRPSR